IGFAVLLGAINGLAITWGRVVPFIATLAMLTIARGLALWMSDKTPISLSQLDILQRVGSGRVLGVPVPALVFLAVTVAGWVLLNRTTFGRHTIAVGGHRTVAPPGSPASAPTGSSSPSTSSPGCAWGSRRPCCRAGWPAPPRWWAASSSWTRSPPWSSAGARGGAGRGPAGEGVGGGGG